MNDKELIWENYRVKILKEADILGRAYRMARKSVGVNNQYTTKKYTVKEFYNYIKDAQKKAKEVLKTSRDRNRPITIFHMVNYDRLDRNPNRLLDAIKYLLSKKDEEISVSMDSQPWEIQNSIVLVGTVSDLLEVYDSDTYTTDSKERYPQDIRELGSHDWDEVIINLTDVKWESFYDNIHNEKAVDLLKNADLSQIYSHDELMGHFDSPRALQQEEFDEKYKELSVELGEKYKLINKFLEFMDGGQSNAEVIRNSEAFSDILSKLAPIDEYTINELMQWEYDENSKYESEKVEKIRPTTELGRRITEKDIIDLKTEINSVIDLQQEISDAWDALIDELNNKGDYENESRIQKSKNLNSVTENGALYKHTDI